MVIAIPAIGAMAMIIISVESIFAARVRLNKSRILYLYKDIPSFYRPEKSVVR